MAHARQAAARCAARSATVVARGLSGATAGGCQEAILEGRGWNLRALPDRRADVSVHDHLTYQAGHQLRAAVRPAMFDESRARRGRQCGNRRVLARLEMDE